MKIILSRKGFDSSNGFMPSPILPDGTLLSLPIPSDEVDLNTYSDLSYGNLTYFDIIKSLNPKTILRGDSFCHLDPDLRKDVKERPSNWKSAFGQMDSALGILRNQNVTIGDLFLFFGWFRQTEYYNGKLQFVKGAPDIHVIYGYLQIGQILSNQDLLPDWLSSHPHYSYSDAWKKGKNVIFLPSEKLSFNSRYPGVGYLNYSANRVLTKDGYSRRYWDLPTFFRNLKITCNPNPWVGDVFKSAGIGQEFVFEAIPEAIYWAERIIIGAENSY